MKAGLRSRETLLSTNAHLSRNTNKMPKKTQSCRNKSFIYSTVVKCFWDQTSCSKESPFFRMAESTFTHHQEQNSLGWSLHTLIFGPPSIMPAPLCLNSFNLRTQRLFDQQCFESNNIHYSILSGRSVALPTSPLSDSYGHRMPRMSAGNRTHWP